MKQKIGPIAIVPPTPHRPDPAPPSPDEETLLQDIHCRGDQWMARFMVVHLLIAAGLAHFHQTWLAALFIGGAAASVFFLFRRLWPGRLATRMVAGISLQAFVALHIFQMAGLAEMHFFFFTAVTAMIIYQDWRAFWPGVLAIIAQHAVFHHLHNQGIHPGGLPFFEPEHVSSLRMNLHYAIALTQVAIASYWAHSLRQQSVRNATQRTELEKANRLLQDQSLELEIAIEQLQDSALQLEMANEELRESEARFRSTFDQAAVGIGHVGLDGSWLRVNDRLCEIVGYSRGELTRLTFQEITHPDDLEADLEQVRQVLAGQIPTYSLEKRYIRKDRSVIWINLTVSLVRDAQGSPAYFISVIEDIDARKGVEAERDELHASEKAAREEAESANRAKGEFLATMSHELRTPLNAVIGFTELMELGIQGPVTEPQAKSLSRIRSAGQYLLSLINDVLNFARVEAGRVEIRETTVPLGPLFAEVEPLMAPQMERKGLDFEVEFPDSRLSVQADPEKVQQILLNLLSNACKYTDTGGSVQLTCGAREEAVWIRVRDTGRGIPPDRQESIFEPFVQVDRDLSRESQQGLGLGLAISRELARAMGGELSVESTPGHGSTFTLSLRPARPGDAAESDRRAGGERRSGEERRVLAADQPS